MSLALVISVLCTSAPPTTTDVGVGGLGSRDAPLGDIGGSRSGGLGTGIDFGPGGLRKPRHYEDVSGDLPNEPITAVAIDPTDDELVYAGADGFLFRSDDGGESWRPVLSFPRGTAVDPTDLETRAGNLNLIDDLPTSGELDYGDPADRADRSDGFGSDIVDEDDLPEGDEPSDDGLGFVGDDGALPDGDFTSASFDVVAWPREGPGVRSIAFVPGSKGILYVATPRGLYRSTSAGELFDRVLVPGGVLENDVRDIVVDPLRPSRITVATAAGVFSSRDGGASFKKSLGPLSDVGALALATGVVSGTVHILVGTTGGLWRSTDDGATFNQMLLKGAPSTTGVGAVAIAVDGEITYAGTALGLFSGERSAPILERFGGVPPVLVECISPDPSSKRALAVGTLTRGVLLSNNAGLTVVDAENVPAAEVTALARPSRDPAALWVATDRGLFRSDPGSGIVVTTSAIKRLRAQWSREPTLGSALTDALAYARLDPNAYGDMRARAAYAKVLPRVRMDYRFAFGRTVNTRQFVLRAGDELPPGVDQDNDNVDLFGNTGFVVLSPAEGFTHLVRVLLVWDLDEVVLNPDEVRVGRQQPYHHAAERRIVERVQEAFAARRRLMTELAMEVPSRSTTAVKHRVRDTLRLEELTAELDAATGGTFSAHAVLTATDSLPDPFTSSKEAP